MQLYRHNSLFYYSSTPKVTAPCMYRIKAKHISNFRPITTESSTMQLYRSTQSHQRPVKQSKIASQRQYRVKEGDGFQELRDVIRSMTGEAPQTRREILTKGSEYRPSNARYILIPGPSTAAELLKQISKENEASSRHEPLPALEIPSAPLYESDQHPHTSYGRHSFLVAQDSFS